MKRIAKKIISFILNPHLLICLGIAWIITNGWSYILFVLGTVFESGWMLAVSGAYLAFLWLPISPEKIVTVLIAIGLMRVLFPKDEKTLGVLRGMIGSLKTLYKSKKELRAMKKREKNNTLTKKDELTLFLQREKTPFSEIAVYHCGECLYTRSFGKRDEGDLYFIYSLTKVVSAVAVVQLYERRIIDLDDPVSKYLPEYATLTVNDNGNIHPAEVTLTVRHLLTMTGGFDYKRDTDAIQDTLANSEGNASTREIVRAISKSELHFEPGTHFLYSLCHDILAAVIEVASGMTFGEYLKENIFSPLGMQDTEILPPDSERLKRIHSQYTYKDGEFVLTPKTCSFHISGKYESGGAGITTTLSDYARFVDALASGGVSKNGVEILRKETLNLLTHPELSAEAHADFERIFSNKPGYSYGLGVRVHTDKEKSGGLSPLGEFGWSGAAGSYALVDIENGLSVCYLEHVLGHPSSYNIIHPTVRDLAYGILEEYKGENRK